MGAWGGNLGRVVLVTGVARPLAGRFVRRVQRESDVDRVIGVDTAEPVHRLGGAAEFVPADIRQPDITGVLARYGVDTVVHMDVNASPHPVPSGTRREAASCL
jgi:UDP-glucose 4-epimerase